MCCVRQVCMRNDCPARKDCARGAALSTSGGEAWTLVAGSGKRVGGLVRPDQSGGVQESLLTTANGRNSQCDAGCRRREGIYPQARHDGVCLDVGRGDVVCARTRLRWACRLLQPGAAVHWHHVRCFSHQRAVLRLNLLLCRRSILAYERELAGCLGESCCIQWTPT